MRITLFILLPLVYGIQGVTSLEKLYYVCVGDNLDGVQMCFLNNIMTIQDVFYAVTSCWNSTDNCCPDNSLECISSTYLDNPSYYNSIKNSCDNRHTCSPFTVQPDVADPSDCDGANVTNLLIIKVKCVNPYATTPVPQNTDSNLSPGAVAGIVILCIFLVVILVIIVVNLAYNRKLPSSALRPDTTTETSVPYGTMQNEVPSMTPQMTPTSNIADGPVVAVACAIGPEEAGPLPEKNPGDLPPDYSAAAYNPQSPHSQNPFSQGDV